MDMSKDDIIKKICNIGIEVSTKDIFVSCIHPDGSIIYEIKVRLKNRDKYCINNERNNDISYKKYELRSDKSLLSSSKCSEMIGIYNIINSYMI